ncbi:hypothetical protein PG984_014249 [Apiospora sp. TS-2023a]
MSDDALMGDTYPYEPLKTSTSIRLLYVERNKTSAYATPLYRFVETDLDNHDGPDYVCLSYTWDAAIPGGDDHPGSASLIEIENAASKAVFKLAVRPNLGDFLDQLVRSRHIAGNVYIWIDALCVNQGDLGERACQVGLMRRVYIQCRETIVWLGTEHANSRLAVELIKHLGTIPQETFDERAGWPSPQEPAQYGSEHWAALGALIERNWFHRVWTVQEYLLPRRVSFWCGDESVGVQGLSRSISRLGVLHIRDIFPLGLKTNWSTFCNVRNMIMCGAKDRGVPLTLSASTNFTRCRSCSDQRDAVYGSLALSCVEMDADYTQEPGDVFATYANKAGPQFFVPYNVEHGKYRRTPGLPSWIPDFAVPLEPSSWVQSGLNRVYRAGRSAEQEEAASSSLPISSVNLLAPLPSTNPRILAVMGMFVDCVRVASGTWNDIPTGQFLVDALTALATLPHTSDGVPVLEKLRQTLILGRSKNVRGMVLSWQAFVLFFKFTLARWISAQDRSGADHEFLHGVLDRLRHTPRGFEVPNWDEIVALSKNLAGKSSEQQYRDGVGNEKDDAEMRRYYDTFENLCVDRRFFTTSGGRMGVGPDNLTKGAVVCIIQNLDFPVLLDRGSEGRYRLIGVCYVSGIMHGEALEGREFTRVEIG